MPDLTADSGSSERRREAGRRTTPTLPARPRCEAQRDLAGARGEAEAGGVCRTVNLLDPARNSHDSRERWFRTLVANSNDLLAVLDAEATVVYANPAAERMLGFAADDQIGTNVLELIHPDDRDATSTLFFEGTQHAGTNGPTVFRFRTVSGDWRFIEAVATNCLDDPAIQGVVINAHDVSEQANLARALRTLSQGNQILVHATDEASLLTDTCENIVASGGYLLAWVGYAMNDKAHTVRPVASAGRTEYLDGLCVGWGKDRAGGGPTGTAIRTRTVQVLNDMRRSKKFAPWRAAAEESGFRTSCVLPLVVDDVVVGALSIYAGEPGAFDSAEIVMLQELAEDLAYGIGRLRDAEELEHSRQFLSAITDNMAEGMMATDSEGIVTFVNAAAERLLGWEAADLIGKPAHQTYHFQRPDGAPYPAEDCPLATVWALGETLHIANDMFLRRDGTPIPVAYSASPLRTDRMRGAVIVFDDISAQAAEQLRITRELEKLAWVGRIRDALDQDRFTLYAQPIVDLSTGAVVQHELLIRMVAADGSIVLPDRFLPTAEEFGLISEIDRWVVGETARLAAAGDAVEFNLSAKSAVDPKMLTLIRNTLESNDISPGSVVCEITETALLRDTAAAEAFVRGLNDMGCKVALDDFGAGYGGFAYLKRLPVSYLKIDREFVRDLPQETSSRHVVSAVVSLAKAFNLQTVAEGAEDDATLALLKELDVDRVQGYAIAAPAPALGVLEHHRLRADTRFCYAPVHSVDGDK